MSGPRGCPRWNGCSAPICPLDPYWQRRQHLDGERVCGLLCELAKDGGEARLRTVVSGEVVATLTTVAPQVSARWHRIRRQVQRASLTDSRIASGQRLADKNAGAGEASIPVATDLPASPPADAGRVLRMRAGGIGSNEATR